MFDLDETIADLRRKDAEEQAAAFPSTAFALNSARKAAEKLGNRELADLLDRRLVTEFPKVADHMSKLKNWNDQLLKILRAHKTDADIENLREVYRAGRIDGSYLREQYDLIVTQNGWRTTAENILAAAREYRTEATRQLERSISAATTATVPTEEALLFEQQATRAWRRLQAALDDMETSKAQATLHDQIVKARSPLERGFLYEEGISYLKARGLKSGDTALRAALAEAVPRIKLEDSEETLADVAAATAEYNARFTLGRLAELPPRLELESMNYFERQILERHFVGAERSDLADYLSRSAHSHGPRSTTD